MPKNNMPNFMKEKKPRTTKTQHAHLNEKEKMPRTTKTQHACLNEKKRCPEQRMSNMPTAMKGKCPEQSKRNMPIGMKGKCVQQRMSDVSMVREENALNTLNATCHANMHTTPTISHHCLAWQCCVHRYQIFGAVWFP